jgi:hypothetical protein
MVLGNVALTAVPSKEGFVILATNLTRDFTLEQIVVNWFAIQ